MSVPDPNLYIDSGLEFTKKFEDPERLARVKLRKRHDVRRDGNPGYEVKVTIMQDNRMTVMTTVRLEDRDVTLSAAESIAHWAANAPYASPR